MPIPSSLRRSVTPPPRTAGGGAAAPLFRDHPRGRRPSVPHATECEWRVAKVERTTDHATGSGGKVPVRRGSTSAAVDRTDTWSTVESWLDQVLAEARDRYGHSPAELADRFHDRRAASRAVLVECNTHQAAHLAGQLEDALDIEVVPWSLRSRHEPPLLPLIGTYFHYPEMCRRWPHRVPDMRFVTLRTDPILADRVRPLIERYGIVGAVLVERDIATAHEAAAEMSAILGFAVKPVAGDPAGVLAALPQNELLLVSPALWDALPPELRALDRVIDPQASIILEDVERLRSTLACRQRSHRA
jgi:hypothetical protein